MRPATRAISAIAVAHLSFLAPVAAQTVQDVVDGMYAAIAESAEGVDDYTLVQTVSGFETRTYFEKEVVDGHPVFVVRQTSGGGGAMSVDDDMPYNNLAAFGDDLVEHGRYAGRQEVDGHPVHVIAIDDLSQIDFAAPSADDMEFVPRSGSISIDADQFVPRRMVFVGDATSASGVHEVTTTVDLRDYREVRGLMIPYVTAIQIEGVGEMIDPEMRAQYEEMKRQLESLPESQRAMFEQMMGAQMEQFEKMMAGEGGAMTMEVVVTDVRVNEGPPGA